MERECPSVGSTRPSLGHYRSHSDTSRVTRTLLVSKDTIKEMWMWQSRTEVAGLYLDGEGEKRMKKISVFLTVDEVLERREWGEEENPRLTK